MIIRDATVEDFPDIEIIGGEFAEAAGQPEVDSESLRESLGNLLNGGILKVAENGSIQGVAGALVFPAYWNRNEIMAQELFWFLRPEYRGTSTGLKLLISLENSAREKGAKRLMMLCLDALDGDKIASMYERLDYEPQERTYVKWL